MEIGEIDMMISKSIKGRRKHPMVSKYTLATLFALLPFALTSPARAQTDTTLQRLIHWNTVTLDAEAADKSLASPDEVGPARTGRAFAMVHIAMYDAVVAINGGFASYTGQVRSNPTASADAAIAQAAHDTLVVAYPSQAAQIDGLLQADLATIADGSAKTAGLTVGQEAASAILTMRANDGSQVADPCIVLPLPPGCITHYSAPPIAASWQMDPISQSPFAIGASWGSVTPFTLSSGSQFRIPAPPILTSLDYISALTQVKTLGGDNVHTLSLRTPDQTTAGIFWSYDGSPGLGTPPRLYNQIVVQIAQARTTDVVSFARLLALVNTAIADAGIAAWDSKYFHHHWRPIGGIREVETDGNILTIRDPNWTPLGAQSDAVGVVNATPPFPSYPSGHATFGGATFEILRRFYGTDNISFTIVSDEFNGVTRDNQGNVRSLTPRSFATLSQAEHENAQSRIYLGVHWPYDATNGITLGRNVAGWVWSHDFTPL
jgi:membrane-associated phospholipid phosphatase